MYSATSVFWAVPGAAILAGAFSNSGGVSGGAGVSGAGASGVSGSGVWPLPC